MQDSSQEVIQVVCLVNKGGKSTKCILPSKQMRNLREQVKSIIMLWLHMLLVLVS